MVGSSPISPSLPHWTPGIAARSTRPPRSIACVSELIDDEPYSPGRSGPAATVEVEPLDIGPVRTEYAPCHDGDPDPGEIVWTWVPFEENDGRGKDRPVLIVAREPAGTLLAVQLSSKRHDHDSEWLPIGVGPWDRSGRDSWVNLDRVMRVHPDGMRREACALDRGRFNLAINRLKERYKWS